jgi:Ni/Co efflux regulator RcnB
VTRRTKIGLIVPVVLAAASVALAEPPPPHGEAPHGGAVQRPPAHGEPHPGPSGYARVTEPKGWNNRPAEVDRAAYQHNFQAARSYNIGVYRRPPGWVAHRWVYGQVLPRAYWLPPYILADYWLFALEVPPPGYEWVRDDTDAILVNITTGQILQVEYGVFA